MSRARRPVIMSHGGNHGKGGTYLAGQKIPRAHADQIPNELMATNTPNKYGTTGKVSNNPTARTPQAAPTLPAPAAPPVEENASAAPPPPALTPPPPPPPPPALDPEPTTPPSGSGEAEPSAEPPVKPDGSTDGSQDEEIVLPASRTAVRTMRREELEPIAAHLEIDMEVHSTVTKLRDAIIKELFADD